MSGNPQRVPGVLVETAGDEYIAYVRSRDTAHAMNASAGALFHQIDGERSIDELAVVLGIELDVALLGVQELVEAGLVIMDSAEIGSASRRQLLKKIGVGTAAAAALPIVESIVAPTRAAASSLPGETEVPGGTNPPVTDPPVTNPPITNPPVTDPPKKPKPKPADFMGKTLAHGKQQAVGDEILVKGEFGPPTIDHKSTLELEIKAALPPVIVHMVLDKPGGVAHAVMVKCDGEVSDIGFRPPRRGPKPPVNDFLGIGKDAANKMASDNELAVIWGDSDIATPDKLIEMKEAIKPETIWMVPDATGKVIAAVMMCDGIKSDAGFRPPRRGDGRPPGGGDGRPPGGGDGRPPRGSDGLSELDES